MIDISKFKDLEHVVPSIINNTARIAVLPFPSQKEGRYDACIHCPRLQLTAAIGVYASALDAVNAIAGIIEQVKRDTPEISK